MAGDKPRISVAMPTRHEGIARIAGVLRDEGLLGEFLVPFDAARIDGALGRFVPQSNRLRRALAQWKTEPRGHSGAALQEVAVSTAYRLFRGRRVAAYPARLVPWRARAMERSIRRGLTTNRPDAMVLLQNFHRDALRRGPSGLWLFANSDIWDLEEMLYRAAERAEPGALRREIRREVPHEAARENALALALVGAVITESTRMASIVRRYTPPSTPVISIGQGVDLDLYRPGGGREFAARPLRVLQLSRIVHGKGVLVADAAAVGAASAVASWTVAGWEAERSPELVRAVTRIGLAAAWPRSRVVAELQQADVFVLPTLGDSMPRAVLEAMACGLPVITTDRAGYDDVIRDGEDGFVVPALEVEPIAALLTRLSSDGELRRRIGLAARVTAERHPWGQVSERFRQGLHETLLPALSARA